MGAPLNPSPGPARDQLAHELDHPIYWVHHDLLRDALAWLWRVLSGHGGARDATSTLTMVLVCAAVVALAAFIIRWVVAASRGTAASARAPRGSSALVQQGISVEQYLDQARRALAAGDPDAAVTAGFRSLVVALDRAGVLGDSPARTAHEVALLSASALPHEADAVGRAATWFDIATYGVAPAPRTSGDQARATIDLASRLAPMGVR